LLALALLPALALARAEGLAETQVLRRGNGAEVETLDPHRAESVSASNILRDLYEGLTIEAPDGSLIPGAAESWELSADAASYTFRLRPDGRWSNGDPVRAEDFVYGLRRSVDPATGSEYAQILAPILNAEAVIAGTLPVRALGVEALDDLTLRIRLKAPTPYFLGQLSHSTAYPVHRASVEAHGEAFSRPGNLVGNGAFVLSEWVVQSHIRLKRNPHYWDNADTLLDEVFFYAIEDQSSELKRYRAGELDYTEDLPNKQFKWIKENLGAELKIAPYLGTYYFGFNLTKPPFKDNLKLRQALSMSIDRDIVTQKVSGLGERPAYSWVPPGLNDYTPARLDYADLTQAERNRIALRLYQEAGYSAANPLRIEIRYNTSENHKKLAIAFAAMWKETLGVVATLVNEEWKVFLETRKQKRITQVFRAGWIGDYNDPYTFIELFQSDHGINDPGYNSPEYDALVAAIAVEIDAARRRELMQQAEALLLRDHAILPIYSYVSKHLIKPYVGGWQPNILNHSYSKNLYILKH
jgi:oligopeptide transport system substrate-binding protein